MCWYPTLYNSKLYKYLYTVTIQLYSYTVYDKLNSDIPGQNGIWAKFNISDLKMMMKSGLGKIFLKFLHALTMPFLLLNFDQKYKFSNKNNKVSAWRNFKKYFYY